MSFAEAWGKKAARDNWVTLEKTRQQIGLGAATEASHMRLVMFFAEPDQLDSFVQSTRGQNWSEAFEEITSLGTSNLDGDEPFGFADGISQPQIDWDAAAGEAMHSIGIHQRCRAG